MGLIGQDWPRPFKTWSGVHAGDAIHTVVGLVNGRYQATVTDVTQHHSLVVGCAVPKQGGWAYAEWIAEKQPNQPVLDSVPLWFNQMGYETRKAGQHKSFRWVTYETQALLVKGRLVVKGW